MSEEWGPWTEHDGNGCPVKNGEMIHVIFDDEDEFIGVEGWEGISAHGYRCTTGPQSWLWQDALELGCGDLARVIRYRIRKPRGMAILESILTDLPMPTERVDA